MTNLAIQRSIEIQEAAKKCGITKPKMTRIVNLVNKEFPHHPAEMIAEIVNDVPQELEVREWEVQSISGLIVDIIREGC